MAGTPSPSVLLRGLSGISLVAKVEASHFVSRSWPNWKQKHSRLGLVAPTRMYAGLGEQPAHTNRVQIDMKLVMVVRGARTCGCSCKRRVA